MNPVLILTHNCLELTKKCVESVRSQDIPTHVWIIDNGSTDGTVEWAGHEDILEVPYPCNVGVSRGWNQGLACLFDGEKQSHCLVVNNDTLLPPWFYSSLLEYDVPFVTGISVNTMEAIAEKQPKKELGNGPDFSAFLIRKSAWDLVGPFDEEMVSYASDNDWHVRAHRAGLNLWNSGVHFYHERSSTIKNADAREHRELCLQADADREVFREKYQCLPWEPKYAELFK